MAKENKNTAKKTTTASKKRRNIVVGTVNILASFNNTIVSISDTQGNVIAWSSSGKMGFKGSRKSTPYAAQLVTSNAVEKAKDKVTYTIEFDVIKDKDGNWKLTSLDNETIKKIQGMY